MTEAEVVKLVGLDSGYEGRRDLMGTKLVIQLQVESYKLQVVIQLHVESYKLQVESYE